MGVNEWVAIVGVALALGSAGLTALIWIVRNASDVTSRLEKLAERDQEHEQKLEEHAKDLKEINRWRGSVDARLPVIGS